MVLAYHEIFPSDSLYLYAITCEVLESHVKLLREVEAASGNKSAGEFTFDDGHLSQFERAAPLLTKHGIKGTFFVTPGWTGTERQYMDWPHLKELARMGHRVQSHGWSHRLLTNCADSELQEEVIRSKQTLEDRLSIDVDSISVPHGRWDRRVLDACLKAGYRAVYVSDPWLDRRSQSSGVQLIGRFIVKRTTRLATLRRVLAGNGAALTLSLLTGRVKECARRVAGDGVYHGVWRRLAGLGENRAHPPFRDQELTALQMISSGGYYGAESMVVNLSKALQSINSCRSIVGVFQNSQNPHIEVAEKAAGKGLEVEIVRCTGRFDWRAVRQTRALIRKQKVDVVHCHGFKANFYVSLATVGMRKPLLATYHLDWPDGGVALYLYHALDRLVLRRFKKVAAVSESIRKSLQRGGLSGKNLTTIPNGLELSEFEAFAPPVTKEPPSRIVIGVVARLTPQKGHRHLLEAVPELLRTFPNLTFLFVGDGPYRGTIEQTIDRLGIRDHVILAGKQSNMLDAYRSIDLFVLPSINEGMPMAILEALAARRPVIACRVGAVPMLIQDGLTGLLVEPGDPKALSAAIARLLLDPGLRSALIEEGWRHVSRHFSADRMALQYYKLYLAAMALPDPLAEVRCH